MTALFILDAFDWAVNWYPGWYVDALKQDLLHRVLSLVSNDLSQEKWWWGGFQASVALWTCVPFHWSWNGYPFCNAWEFFLWWLYLVGFNQCKWFREPIRGGMLNGALIVVRDIKKRRVCLQPFFRTTVNAQTSVVASVLDDVEALLSMQCMLTMLQIENKGRRESHD